MVKSLFQGTASLGVNPSWCDISPTDTKYLNRILISIIHGVHSFKDSELRCRSQCDQRASESSTAPTTYRVLFVFHLMRCELYLYQLKI